MSRLVRAIVVLLVVSGCSAAPAAQPQSAAPEPPLAVATEAPTPIAAAAEPTPITPAATSTPLPADVDTQGFDDGTARGAGAAAADDSNVVGAVSTDAGDGTIQTSTSALAVADTSCDDTARPDPLPAPGSARSQDFFRSFREPLAPAPLYDPPGPKRVGLQAGHWLNEQVPPELGRLQAGAIGGGKQEWQVNLDVAQRTAALLQAAGIQTDVLPATVPPRYQANLFLAIHSDGDPAGQARGFKVARPGFSSLPSVDDKLVEAINQTYATETELPRDDEHISLRMRYYYAFNSRRYCHAVAPGVPQAILEMGYLTSSVDRQWLLGDPDRLAHAIADSLEAFLATLP